MADKSQKFISLVRIGFAARGLTYMLLGWLAIVASRKVSEGNEAVFEMIADWTLGTMLLIVIAAGLLGYSLFKLASAIGDIQHRGADKEGIAERVGDAASGIAYAVLAYAAFQFATGAKAVAEDSTRDTAGLVLTMDLGPVLLGLIGLGFVGGAFTQARHAVMARFMNNVSTRAPRGVKMVGRLGHAARAVVFAAVGWSLLEAAWFADTDTVNGVGQALVGLGDEMWLYSLTAAGLILFGMFSLVMARYQIIPDFDAAGLKPKFRS